MKRGKRRRGQRPRPRPRHSLLKRSSCCFISHSRADREFAGQLSKQMYQRGLRVWHYSDNGTSQKIDQVDRIIRFRDKFLLVISEESMSSEWVETEIYQARQRENKDDGASSSQFGYARSTRYGTGSAWAPTPGATWPGKSASTSSRTSPTGRTTTRSGQPSSDSWRD